MTERVFFDVDSGIRIAVPLVRETGHYWRHCDRECNPMPSHDVARAEGRYHVLNGTPVWYGADSVEGAWAEFFKHYDLGTSPLRYLAHVHVREIAVIDLCDERTLTRLSCSPVELVASGYGTCQKLGQLLLGHQRVDGILAPSAAHAGGRVLILKRQSVIDSPREVVEASRSVHDLMHRIGSHDAA
ncbi:MULTISPECIES: RES family NAD+ phosphorylase [Streptomyces]|uniref:RES family NAD+ phosphorylase n=1 Tax=Streptomyces TaxID=1883 RepID=UPI00099BF340